MGISGIIAYLNTKVPQVIRPVPSLEVFGGKKIFVDCSIILRRSLHASLRAVLDRHKLTVARAGRGTQPFVDTKAIKEELMGNALKPLMVMNKAFQSVDKGGGIEAVFVLGPLEDVSTSQPKAGSESAYVNILDTKSRDLIPSLKAYLTGNTTFKFYPSLSQRDVSDISEALVNQFAKVQIRTPEIAKKCVEFCTSEEDYVLSDDTNVLAYGAPNVVRDYLGTKEPSTINHRDMLSALGLSRDQFIDLCILLGYKDNVRIPEIGPERAYGIIRRFGSLDKFLASSFYRNLFKTKKAAELLTKLNMGLGEFTDRYFNLEKRKELRSYNLY